jgi:predicted solute-binding protein
MGDVRETIRLGVVPYLNVQPMIAHLSSQVDRIEICAQVPSRLVPMLAEGAIDVGIAPVFALLEHSEWAMVPGVGIACDGPVESVLLVSASPLDEIQRVFLDPASMTSSALLQVLMTHHWRHGAKVLNRSRVRVRPERGTGYLVIGDRALRLRHRMEHVIDLGAAWKEWTGLPFVFAVWAVRPGVDIGPLAARLAQAPQLQTDAMLQQIAREYHGDVGIPEEEALRYLRDSLRYRLDARAMQGLRLFLNACQGLGFGPKRMLPIRILRRSEGWSETG